MKASALYRLFSTTVKTANPSSEMKKALQKWSVMRIDTNGNTFKMRDGLTEEQAKKIADEYEARGHHQGYWATTEAPKNTP
ncbi:MAG: hypothetical protein P1U32_08945 [Legionellaceae bacterium]|nr:hypothetical protein [Legionellaceae bacterium]